MNFFTNINIKPLEKGIDYQDKLLLIGSCFTEHIGNHLIDVKFSALQNPHGILFDPISVCNSLIVYMENKEYGKEDLIYLNEAWHSWQHHSRFSGVDEKEVLGNINAAVNEAHERIKEADWLIITLGSSFVYKLASTQQPVANCHKAPAQTFVKHLSTIEEIIIALDTVMYRLFQINSKVRVLFTISPVRHLRDGVVENNRSKARLIEAVHHLVNKFDRLHYFPAYELVIDVLRDYRFYDIDLAHPNYAATQFVLEKFTESCIYPQAHSLMEEIRKIRIAANHKPFNPLSKQHQQFLDNQLKKLSDLEDRYPFLDFHPERKLFSNI